MRTTLRLDDRLLTDAKEHAAKTGRTLNALLEDALRTYLALENRPKQKRSRKLPTYREGGLQPGVDLDNSADLQDLMDAADAAR